MEPLGFFELAKGEATLKSVFLVALLLLSILFTGCGGQQAGADGDVMTLKLGHNMSKDHAVNKALLGMAKEVEDESSGKMKLSIYAGGILGSETDMILQIQAGALDMAKVSAATLGNFDPAWNAFSVPYVFDDKAHFYRFMDSPAVDKIYQSTKGQGFIAITYMDSGARSFYTSDKPIRRPEDLKGLKIRTMDSPMAVEMMRYMGGAAMVMGYSDIYTAMQQGIIDGAENNITALRDHADVAKYYCMDEHTRIPDVLLIRASVFDVMSDSEKEILVEAAKHMTEEYKTSWADFETQVREQVLAQHPNLQFVTDVDKASFRKVTSPILENLRETEPSCYEIVQEIRAQSKEEVSSQ